MKLDMLWGFLDQGLQSLINLSVGFLLIYFESKSNYGLYGLGFAAILLLVGFSNALVSTQMTVIAPSKRKEEQELFCISLIVGFFSLFIPIVILCIISYEIVSSIYGFITYKKYVYIIMAVAPALMVLEIMRRYFYLKLTPKKVFMMDVLYAAIYACGLSFIFVNDIENKFIFVIAVNGISAFLSSFIFFMKSGLKMKVSFKDSIKIFKEAWVCGKWGLAGVMVTWVQNQGYVYVLGISKGSGLVAEANAARLFLAPIGVLSTSISKVIMPRLVKLKVIGNTKQAIIITRKILFIILSFIIIYVAILNVYLDFIVDKLMDNKYHMISNLVFFWSIYFICQAFRNNNSILLQVFRMFKKITLSNFFTASLVLVLSMLVIVRYDIQSMIIVMSFGELLLAIIFWKFFKNESNKY